MAVAPATKVWVRLTDARRRVVRADAHSAYTVRRAHILLTADAGGPAWPDERIDVALNLWLLTVAEVRQQFAAERLDPTLHKEKAAGRQYRKLDSRQERGSLPWRARAPRPGTPGGR
jgi:hypothetical protein